MLYSRQTTAFLWSESQLSNFCYIRGKGNLLAEVTTPQQKRCFSKEKAHFQHCFILCSYRPKLTLQNCHENVSGQA